MPKIKVGDSGTAYFNDDLRKEGYVGELNLVPNACAGVLEKPGVEPEDVLKSLEVLTAHYNHLVELKNRPKKELLNNN